MKSCIESKKSRHIVIGELLFDFCAVFNIYIGIKRGKVINFA
jgi:hypothetical protein